ncbi:MAG: N-acetylmuramoyl-L-alanine amidase [Clostridia bacterium]|nr:N-acetylmuramoyl-L-alanine amidase [Clostridia bacterium]
MRKMIIKLLFLSLVLIGIGSGIFVNIKRAYNRKESQRRIDNIFTSVQSRTAILTNFYTYGDTLNIEGKLSNVLKDNFEGAKIIITDGTMEKLVRLDAYVQDNELFFSTSEINDAIELDKLALGNYYILLRLKLNNSSIPKIYFLNSEKNLSGIEYYTVTRNSENRKINIDLLERKMNGKNYKYLSVKVLSNKLPEDVYDFVIDAGHGGKDVGERLGTYTEADITLDYAKYLKEKLEELGLKVKLTRDSENSNSFNYVNMYNNDGRITIACKSKAKYMISFHVNNGNSNLTGLEIYSPTKSNLTFSKLIADRIIVSGANSYSNNSAFKKKDGVYVWNFTNPVIKQFQNTAEKKGYEPYQITESTPYQYTIREVGGVATNAYVDGRNKDYSKNEYYDSRQGIECYQVELGYIKTDLEKILYNREAYINSITQVIKDYLEI